MMNTNAKKQKANAPIKVESVEDFIEEVQSIHGSSLYRGLANFTWPVEAAASRRVRAGKRKKMNPSNEAMKHYIMVQLLGKARLHGLDEHNGQPLSDLKLLAQLQHYGAATCMIDFTHDPLVALWFACHGEFAKDGKVIVMNTAMADAITDVKELKEGIKYFLDGGDLRTWPPTPRDNRVVAQHSVFVFGEAVINKKYYKEMRVPRVAKKKILAVLREKFEMTEESLFSDFTGFALANAQDKPCYEEYSADTYYAIAREYWRQGEFEQAKYCCDKAIKQDSEHFRAYYLRGKCYQRLEKTAAAIRDYSRIIGSYSPHIQTRSNIRTRSGTRTRPGIRTRSVIKVRPSIQARRHVRTLISRGTAYAMESKFGNAMVDFIEASQIATSGRELMTYFRFELSWAFYGRGCLMAWFGEHKKAIEYFTDAIDADPDSKVVYRERAKSYRAVGDDKAAENDEKKVSEGKK